MQDMRTWKNLVLCGRSLRNSICPKMDKVLHRTVTLLSKYLESFPMSFAYMCLYKTDRLG